MSWPPVRFEVRCEAPPSASGKEAKVYLSRLNSRLNMKRSIGNNGDSSSNNNNNNNNNNNQSKRNSLNYM